MFDIFSWQHIFVLVVIALVVVGPKDLPRILHMAGKWASKARKMAGNIRKSMDEVMRESELEELRAQVEGLKKINPLSGIPNPVSEIKNAVMQPMAPTTQASPEGSETHNSPAPTAS